MNTDGSASSEHFAIARTPNENSGDHGDRRRVSSTSRALQAPVNRHLLPRSRVSNPVDSSTALVPPPSDLQEQRLWETFPGKPKKYGLGLDCPIRASPRGSCTWTPRDHAEGFPDIYKVREHVARHGIICPRCHKCFRVSKNWRQHLKHLNDRDECLSIGHDDSLPGSPLQQTPEILAKYFHPKLPDGSTAEQWLVGYKTLYPDWQRHQHILPSPYYRQNVGREASVYVVSAAEGQSSTGPAISPSPLSSPIERRTSLDWSFQDFNDDNSSDTLFGSLIDFEPEGSCTPRQTSSSTTPAWRHYQQISAHTSRRQNTNTRKMP